MIELVIDIILEFKEFIFISGIFTLLFALILPIFIHRFDYRKGKNSLFYLLYQLDKRGILVLSISILEFIFIVVTIVFQKNLTIAYGAILLLMASSISFCIKDLKFIILEYLHTSLIFLFLILENVMFRYLQEIYFDKSVLVVYVLLNIFILFYSLYLEFQHILSLKWGKSHEKIEY